MIRPILTRWTILGIVLLLSTPAHSIPISASPIRAETSSARTWISSRHETGDASAKAAVDSFYLYGGPGTLQGKFFEALNSSPTSWTGVDRTDQPIYWQVSTFNAETLANHGAGNHAAWCGQSAAQQPGWATGPGYGKRWNQTLLFESPALADPSAGQTVSLDFVFHYDTETAYDFFSVERDSSGSWVEAMSISGTDRDASDAFPAPGVRYSAVAQRALTYAGGDYGGSGGDRIRLRLRFRSDFGYDDEDGRFDSVAGAVQVDDIAVTWSDGSDFEDFESGDFSGSWRPQKPPFVGDFSRMWPQFRDYGLDLCHENLSSVVGFVDAGQVVRNAASAADIPGYPTSTGGETSATAASTLGGWVVNYHGGLSQVLGPRNELPLSNEVWSPEILWDLPGTADDGPEVSGVLLRFSVWADLPFENGLFYLWHIRTSPDGLNWSPWVHDWTIYFDEGFPHWVSREFDVSAMLSRPFERIQVALGVIESVFGGTIGDDATASPLFDNVALLKYRLQGPVISARERHLANDGFPVSGEIDVSTTAARDALDIPFDMAANVASGNSPVDAGDSVVVKAVAQIPGTTLADLRMVWILDRNPLFEDAIRTPPSRSVDQNVVLGPTQWSGEVLASPSAASQPDESSFDLPDQDFLYPGDVLRYYFRATDSDGRVSTLPSNTTGFSDEKGYDRVFTIHGLPSITDAAGAQPSILAWIDFGHREGEAEVLTAFRQLDLVEGRDIDLYTTMAAERRLSNGLGSAGVHGATAAQLDGYTTLLYFAGELDGTILGDGGHSFPYTRPDDIGLLTAWRDLAGARSILFFGDNVSSSLSAPGSAGSAFLETVMGVEVVGQDITRAINGWRIPDVRPVVATSFSTNFLLTGNCPDNNSFDVIKPLVGSVTGHRFWDPRTNSAYLTNNISASVIYDTSSSWPALDRKLSITFPFSFRSVQLPMRKAAVNASPRVWLLSEALDFAGICCLWGSPDPVATPAAPERSLAIFPNPFNPVTTLRFTGLRTGDEGFVRIYNPRGQLVVTLHQGTFTHSTFLWDGTNAEGRSVASGIYMVEAQAGDFHQITKIALLK